MERSTKKGSLSRTGTGSARRHEASRYAQPSRLAVGDFSSSSFPAYIQTVRLRDAAHGQISGRKATRNCASQRDLSSPAFIWTCRLRMLIFIPYHHPKEARQRATSAKWIGILASSGLTERPLSTGRSCLAPSHFVTLPIVGFSPGELVCTSKALSRGTRVIKGFEVLGLFLWLHFFVLR